MCEGWAERGPLCELGRDSPIGQANSGSGHQFAGLSESYGGLREWAGQSQLGIRCFKAHLDALLFSGMSSYVKETEGLCDALKFSLLMVHPTSIDEALMVEADRYSGSPSLCISSFGTQITFSSFHSRDGLCLEGYVVGLKVAPLGEGCGPLKMVLVDDNSVEFEEVE